MINFRGQSRTLVKPKFWLLETIVEKFQPLDIIHKSSILVVSRVLNAYVIVVLY